jgi:hypothetical protein
MASELETISEISDVSYLITRLRLARRKNETEMKEAIVSRLRHMGLLREVQGNEDLSFKNLRAEVTRILGI